MGVGEPGHRRGESACGERLEACTKSWGRWGERARGTGLRKACGARSGCDPVTVRNGVHGVKGRRSEREGVGVRTAGWSTWWPREWGQ